MGTSSSKDNERQDTTADRDHNTSLEVVTSRQVYNTLNDLLSYLVVIDMRSIEEFQTSHMDLALHASGIESMLEVAQESPFTTIVVYGEHGDPSNDAKLETFRHRMTRHRMTENLGPLNILYLKSYSTFNSEYPFMCTDSAAYEEGRLFPSQITESVFLSNFGVASSRKVLQRLGITHVLNCTKDCPFAGQVNDTADTASALQAAFTSLDTTIESYQFEELPSSSRLEPLQSLTCLRIPVIDEKDQQIHEHFEAALRFLGSMKEGDRVVIHCKHGQSRSATVTAAFLIDKYNWDVSYTLNYLKTCRPKVCPNEGFVAQLQSFAELRKSCTA